MSQHTPCQLRSRFQEKIANLLINQSTLKKGMITIKFLVDLNIFKEKWINECWYNKLNLNNSLLKGLFIFLLLFLWSWRDIQIKLLELEHSWLSPIVAKLVDIDNKKKRKEKNKQTFEDGSTDKVKYQANVKKTVK